MQEIGYPLADADVDLAVPDVLGSRGMADRRSVRYLQARHNVEDRVTHLGDGVAIDLLPAGRVVRRGCLVPFPPPDKVMAGSTPKSFRSPTSFRLLDSAANFATTPPARRTDAVELITRLRSFPVTFAWLKPVRQTYLEI